MTFPMLSATSSLLALLARHGHDEESLSRVKLALAVVGVIALLYEARRAKSGRPVSLRWKKAVAGALAVMGVVSYFQLFQFGYRDFYHRWELYHYYVGAKYQRELGYEALYACAAVAEAELPASPADPSTGTPALPAGALDIRTRKLRDLHDNSIVDASASVDQPEVCKSRFSDARWDAFRGDVAFFRRVMWGSYWRDAQKDHGYNATPVWGIAGFVFASLHPATETYMKLLSGLDLTLLSAMFGLVGWAFGWRVMCLSLLFWGTQDASPFYWTGGAFLRQDWLFCAVASVCLVKKGRPGWGGALLMGSALLRVFPLFLFGGWVVMAVATTVKTRSFRLPALYRRLAAGALGAALVLVPLSAAIQGWRSWPEFYHHIRVHNDTPLTNHMGWKTIVAHTAAGRMEVARDDRQVDPFGEWKRMRRERVADATALRVGGALAMMALFVWACWRLRDAWVAQALGCLSIVVFVELTDYYYSFFLYAALLSRVRRPIEIAVLLASALSQVAHLQYRFFDDRFVADSVIFLVLPLFLVVLFLPRRGGEPARAEEPELREEALPSDRSPQVPG